MHHGSQYDLAWTCKALEQRANEYCSPILYVSHMLVIFPLDNSDTFFVRWHNTNKLGMGCYGFPAQRQ